MLSHGDRSEYETENKNPFQWTQSVCFESRINKPILLIFVGELHANFSSFPAHDPRVSDTLFLWYT